MRNTRQVLLGSEGPHLATNNGGKRRISKRAWANSRRGQGSVRTTTSGGPSWPKTSLGTPCGWDRVLSNDYGGACTGQWRVAQDQRGAAEKLAPIGLTSRLGTFPNLSSRDNPKLFSKKIMDKPMPPHYITPKIALFTGVEDPENHLKAFKAQMILSGGSDAIRCKMFMSTFTGTTLQ